MFLGNLFEATASKVTVIYPGRFQPFHKGHASVYNHLAQKYGNDNVYIVTSDKTDNAKSPFSFDEKKKMMILTGVDSSKVVFSTQPYRAMEIVSKLDPSTVLMFAISEKDMAEDPRFQFAPKKDGSPSYFQPFKDAKECKPLSEHAYMITVPTFEFTVLGKPANSASQIRAQFGNADEETKKKIVADLFGKFDPVVYNIMNNKLLPVPAAVGEAVNNATSLITDPEERKRITDLKRLFGMFGGSAGVKRAVYLDSKGLLKATKSEKAFLYSMVDKDGVVNARTDGSVTESSAHKKEMEAQRKKYEKEQDAKRAKEGETYHSGNAKVTKPPVNEISNDLSKNYMHGALQDTITGKKDRNPGISQAMNRISGTQYPLVPDTENPDPKIRSLAIAVEKMKDQLASLTGQPTTESTMKKVNELSSGTLGKYKKAAKETLPKNMHQAGNRAQGVAKAKDKIYDKEVTAKAKATGHPMVQEGQLNEASPLSAAGFSKEFINQVYRLFSIEHTEIPEPMTAKPKANDLRSFVFLSRTNSGKAFAVGLGDNRGFGAPGASVLIDNEGSIDRKYMSASKALAQVAKGQYFAIPFSKTGHYERVRGQGGTEYKRANPRDGRGEDAQDSTYKYMSHVEQLYGPKIRGEMNRVADFVFANLRRFKKELNSNFRGSSQQDQALDIANKLEAAAKEKFDSNIRGSWDQPSYMEQYLHSLEKLSHGFGSIPTNYYRFQEVMDTTPAGLAKFAKFILGTVHEYEERVKNMLASEVMEPLKAESIGEDDHGGVPWGPVAQKEYFDNWHKWDQAVRYNGGTTEHSAKGDGKYIATSMDDGGMGVWDENTGEGWIDLSGESDLDESDPGYNKHSMIGRIRRGHEANNKGWGKLGDLLRSDNEADARNALRKGNRYYNMTNPKKDSHTAGGFPKTKVPGLLAVDEGRFVKGPGGVPLDRHGDPIEPKAPKAPKAPAPKKLTLDDVWRKVEEVVGNIYPDGDPIDWMLPWFKRQGIEDFKVGEIIDRAARKNGYKDMYDYWNSFAEDIGYEKPVREDQDDRWKLYSKDDERGYTCHHIPHSEATPGEQRFKHSLNGKTVMSHTKHYPDEMAKHMNEEQGVSEGSAPWDANWKKAALASKKAQQSPSGANHKRAAELHKHGASDPWGPWKDKHEEAFAKHTKSAKMYGEGVEQVDELSTDSMKRYMGAANKSREDATNKFNQTGKIDAKTMDKMGKRAERTMKTANKVHAVTPTESKRSLKNIVKEMHDQAAQGDLRAVASCVRELVPFKQKESLREGIMTNVTKALKVAKRNAK